MEYIRQRIASLQDHLHAADKDVTGLLHNTTQDSTLSTYIEIMQSDLNELLEKLEWAVEHFATLEQEQLKQWTRKREETPKG